MRVTQRVQGLCSSECGCLPHEIYFVVDPSSPSAWSFWGRATRCAATADGCFSKELTSETEKGAPPGANPRVLEARSRRDATTGDALKKVFIRC